MSSKYSTCACIPALSVRQVEECLSRESMNIHKNSRQMNTAVIHLHFFPPA